MFSSLTPKQRQMVFAFGLGVLTVIVIAAILS
ncbi:MAG: hypothetical protein AVDCRST_MAG93-9470 [uncultured Chloroflexia bacterium]|uniref:Uncharacterized protein n=1 Tax=uncultured Chloroflexia bacterium TaxID=1672391 RepID=A0A6J4NJK8_9CHLR|nr:MAG: hypothetical protein AVDCRST_MAG93-9470 [uncultured Chloroflexia bacterium]